MKRYCYFILLSVIVFQLNSQVVKSELRERVYLQTDKNLYLSGEPIHIKLLTTDQDLVPVVFSKVAYVELLADSAAHLQIKIGLTNGTGSGRMILPTDLPTGYYRLMAYTQFMRNEGVDVFFEKMIAVVNTFQSGYYLESPPVPPKGGETPLRVFTEDRPPSPWGNAGVGLDKTTYSRRDRGELIISGLPENIHTLSVSIAGKDLLNDVEPESSLFQNYKRKQSTKFSGDFLPEYEGHIVMGNFVENQPENLTAFESEVESDADAPSVKITALSFPTVEGIRFFSGQESETGHIRFVTSGVGGTKEIATVVFQADEKYRVDILSPFVTRYAPKKMPDLHLDSAYYSQLLARSVALQVLRYFSKDQAEKQTVSKPHFDMKPAWSYPLDEYTRFTSMREVFIEFITGARFRRRDGKQELSVMTQTGSNSTYGTMVLALIDGVPITDHDIIYNYDPLAVERINIYYGPCSLGGYRFDGVVELITYRRLHADINLPKSTQIFTYEGPQLPYRLDTPDYSDNSRQIWTPDSRHTLLWNPDVKTNGETSISLPFYTSDLRGEFQATVEGITTDGKMFFAKSFFKVEI